MLESIEYEELSDQFYSSWHDKNTKQRRNRRKNDTYSKHHRQQRESQQAHKKKTLTGKQCFDRIDSSLRTVIRRNNIALSLLEQIEGDLVQVFQEDPASIYQCCLDSGYDRFLLHACAQYHNLTCHSKLNTFCFSELITY